MSYESNSFTAKKLPECPTLYPTLEEFESPIHYLSSPSVLSQGNYYGILKIVPPKGWKPDFALDFDSFKFETRLQVLPELSLRNRARADYLKGFNCFQRFKGKAPLIEDGDIYIGVSKPTLDFENTSKYGWIHLIDNSRIHIHDIFISREWKKWTALAVNKDLVYEVVEYSKYLISALNLDSSTSFYSSSNDYNFDKYTSLTRETDPHLVSSYKVPNDPILSEPSTRFKTLKANLDSIEGFIFQNINDRALEDFDAESDDDDKTATARKLTIQAEILNLTPTINKIAEQQHLNISNNQVRINLELNSRATDEKIINISKIRESCKVCHQTSNPELTLLCDNCGGAYHIMCLNPPLKGVPKGEWFCSICLVGGSGNYGFEHDGIQWSLNQFKKWILDNWGPSSKGRHWINDLKRQGVPLATGSSIYPDVMNNEKMTDVGLYEWEFEGLFWSLVSGRIQMPEGFTIRYGADIHNPSKEEITGFPTLTTISVKKEGNTNVNLSEDQLKYARSEWNLTRLPFAKGSLFEYICSSHTKPEHRIDKTQLFPPSKGESKLSTTINTDEALPALLTSHTISGMSIPWMYFGGPLSTFCWHKEDHYTMSANYCHLGAAKQWYGIPSECCEEFERRVKERVAPDIGRKQGDLMHQLVSQIPLEEIYSGDSTLRIYRATQREGEFIVTFPRVYHSGFNYGFNINEAVNFTIFEWLQYSAMAVREYKQVKKEGVFDILKVIRRILEDVLPSNQAGIGPIEFCKKSGVEISKLFEITKIAYWIYLIEIQNMIQLKGRVLSNSESKTVNDILEQLPNASLDRYLCGLGRDKYISKKVNTLDKLASVLQATTSTKKTGADDVYEMDTINFNEEEADNEDNVDLGVCKDCKTRVHFQWVDVDLWIGCVDRVTEQIESLQIEIDQIDRDVLNVQKERFDLNTSNSYNVSDINNIIEKVKRESINEEVAEPERKRPRRGRAQRVKKEEDKNYKVEEEELLQRLNKFKRQLNKQKLILKWLNAKRLREGSFGHVILCLDCFAKEFENLSHNEKRKILQCAITVNEFNIGELFDLWKGPICERLHSFAKIIT